MAPQPRRPDTATPRTLALRTGAFRCFRTPCGTQGRPIAKGTKLMALLALAFLILPWWVWAILLWLVVVAAFVT